MHENREISCASWSNDQDRSVKAINHNADVNVQEKSDCDVVPLSRPNNEGQPTAEVGEARAQTEENRFDHTCLRHRAEHDIGGSTRRVSSGGPSRMPEHYGRALLLTNCLRTLPSQLS